MYLAKFVNEWEHAQDILRGHLFMRRLAWFKKTEETGRADKLEATTRWQRPKPDEVSITLTVHGVEHRLHDLISFVYDNPHLNHYFIYSMFGGYPREQKPIYDIDAFFERVRKFPAQRFSSEFGSYTVLVHNLPDFFDRIDSACETHDYGMKRHFVLYYDPDQDSVGMNEPDNSSAMFCKPNTYSYQQEYRIAIDNGEYKAPTFVLNIGDMSDIAAIYETRSIFINTFLDRDIPRIKIKGNGPLTQPLQE